MSKMTHTFNCSEVEIIKKGNNIILREKPKNLKHAFEILASLPDDFFADEQEDLPPQERNFS